MDRDELVLQNLGLARWVAGRFKGHGVDLDDLLQEANLALIKAAKAYDPSRGIKFSTYAARAIRYELIDVIADGQVIRLSHNLRAWLSIWRKWSAQTGGTFEAFVAEHPRIEDGGCRRRLERLLRTGVPIASCDSEGLNLAQDRRLTELNTLENHDELAFLLGSLAPADRDLIRELFGVDGGEQRSGAEIARARGVTRQAVDYAKQRALGQMRRAAERSESKANVDQSKVRAFVEQNIGPLSRAMGISHWTIRVTYGPCEQPNHDADCGRIYPYNVADINIDPARAENDDDVLRLLCHELAHIVLHPFDLYRDVMLQGLAEGSTAAKQEDQLWVYCVEQAVINLRRLWSGAREYWQKDGAAAPPLNS
jgi:RNA polymerase sigma factor (sigma-70 family)